MKKLLSVCILSALLAACASKSGTSAETVNPRDTVTVPEGITGEDSIAYIENTILQSPISAEDLLGLEEVHAVEESLLDFNNKEKAKFYPQDADKFMANHRDSAALRLANRFMRMYDVVDENGDAHDKMQWAVAVNTALDMFRKEVPSVPSDSALYEIERVLDKFSSQSQSEMNFQSYIGTTIAYYQAIEAYRKWLMEVPSNLKPLLEQEYVAWIGLHEARFNFWRDVSYRQEWYSMKPMELAGYYRNLSENRLAEMAQERAIINGTMTYQQKGRTVTASQWEQWIAHSSVPMDVEQLDKSLIPSDSLVTDHVTALKSTFTQWIKARQALAAALPEPQEKSYDNLTADIHSRMVGRLPQLIHYGEE